MKRTAVLEVPWDAYMSLYAMTEEPEERGGPPTTVEEAVRSGRDALGLAAELLKRHAPEADRMWLLLRSSASMIWLALIAACQAIVLRRAKSPVLQSGPEDVQAARKLARTKAEHDFVLKAVVGEVDLYQTGCVRGDISEWKIAAWMTTARAALRSAAEATGERR